VSYTPTSNSGALRTSRNSWFAMPPFVAPLAVLLLIASSFGDNFLIAISAIAVFVVGAGLLWRRGEPPILLFIFFYQWLQASIAIFYANATGIELDAFPSQYYHRWALATALSLLAVLVMALGLRVGAGSPRADVSDSARRTALQKHPRFWLKFYVGIWLFSTASQAAAYWVPGLSQIMLAFGNFKWAGFLVFTIATFSHPNSNKIVWLIAFLVEFFLSFGGIFSGFKEVFFYTFIALATARTSISPARALTGFALAVALLAIGVVWTAVKVDYRKFVSGGGHAQVVVVEREQAVGKLLDLVSQLDERQLESAARKLVMRISYVEFFGAVLNRIPRMFPHEEGTLWLDAISRPFMPRLFFPDKSAIRDSELVNKYTGLYVSGTKEGTSISLGYIGETYIDFGEYMMVGVLFVFWGVMGSFYLYMISNRRWSPLFGMAFICPILMGCANLETALAKMIGGLAVNALVTWIALTFMLPRYLRLIGR